MLVCQTVGRAASSAVRIGLALAVSAGVVTAGCGVSNDHPPPLLDPGMDGGHADGGMTFDFDATSKPPGCGVGPEGGVCGCLDLPLLVDAPNLYFILDRSGSMNDLGKWNTVRSVIGQVILKLGPRANYGAAVFPDPAQDNCATGVEVAPVRQGDPAGTYGPTYNQLASSLNLAANGGTPTAATFTALAPHLANLKGRTFVILATDGGPNCDLGTTCTAAQCQVNLEGTDPNCPLGGPPDCCDPQHYGPVQCNDGDATASAIAALLTKGVPSYVVGVPGSALYAGILDQMAQAGGTARASEPYYYAVNTADASALEAALSQIAAKVTATCTLPLGKPPPDPGQVNVYLDDVIVPRDATNGWTLSGAVVTLVGQTCQRVLAGDVLSVRVIAGCPTVVK